MSGYTPIFSSITTGTLCGRWPDIGLWPIVLALADKDGIVDVTPAYIAGVTGLPLPEVVACMRRFCEPDPYSRSPVESGARLTLLDSHREWGWKVVNHGKYRELARKRMQQVEATASGRDAERKRRERERKAAASGRVQSCPAESSRGRLSDSDSDADSDSDPLLKEKELSFTNEPGNGSGNATPIPDTPDAAAALAAIRAAYPPGARASWLAGERNARALVREGKTTWPQLLDAVVRYAVWITATGTHPANVARFFTGNDADAHWAQPWELPEHKRMFAGGAL